MQQAGFEIEPFFLTGGQGALFCIHLYPTDTAPKAGILYLHPFAEEMHKSRRMAALQARRFAAEGYAVLQVDLTGCGDSSGDFGDATWEAWHDDARRAHTWLLAKAPGPIILWGLRTGASLAVELAGSLSDIERLLLCQPVINGEQYLNQFLRIKLASEMLSGGQAQSGTKELLSRLDAGEGIEVGGYLLGAAMARSLARMKLADTPPPCPVEWIEIGAEDSDIPAPASLRIVDAWRTAGVKVHARTVTGEPFWITQEITECPNLIEATTEAIRGHP
ncbi:MAG: hydrolase 2, exosortase A system-associated [Gallionellaceae bacterium]